MKTVELKLDPDPSVNRVVGDFNRKMYEQNKIVTDYDKDVIAGRQVPPFEEVLKVIVAGRKK